MKTRRSTGPPEIDLGPPSSLDPYRPSHGRPLHAGTGTVVPLPGLLQPEVPVDELEGEGQAVDLPQGTVRAGDTRAGAPPAVDGPSRVNGSVRQPRMVRQSRSSVATNIRVVSSGLRSELHDERGAAEAGPLVQRDGSVVSR